MKTTSKRVLSALLTVFLLLGTVALAIPASIFSAAAYSSEKTVVVNGGEKNTPYSLKHNADNTVGDIVLHFDQKGHGGSFAKINSDGTVTVKVMRGDMFWIPSVEIDEQSVIHAEAVMDSTPIAGNTIIGPVFNITTSTGIWQTATDTCTGGMLYGGKPGFGIGKYHFQYTNTNGSLQDGSYWSERWQSYSSDIAVWKNGQQINYDISKTGNDVTFTFTDAATDTVITSQTYNDLGADPYDGSQQRDSYHGAVGFLCCWETGGSNTVTYTIKNLQVTNALVNGVRQDFDLVAYLQAQMVSHDYVNLAHNTEYVINGVKLQFDEKGHGDSYAHINEDGTVTVCVGRGDLFWMPNVRIDEQSVIHVEAVMNSTPNTANTIIGPAFDITTETGVWQTATDSCTGGMLYGGKPGFGIGRYQFQYTNSNASLQDGSYWPERWQPYSSSISVFSVGQQINYDISKTGDNVTFTFTDAASDTVITSQTYDDSERNTFKGAVGFLSCWEAGGKPTFTIKNYQVTNALVDGVRQDFDLVAMLSEYMTKGNYVLRSNLSLNGTIGLNIRVDANCYITGTETLVVTDAASNVVASEALSDLWNAKNGYYVCSIPVTAKEMADTFAVCLKNGEDVIDGTSAHISVKSYAEALAAADAEWADLMTAMLEYGAAAQQLFSYNTANLAADISGGISFDASSIAGMTADGDLSFLSGLSGTLTLVSGTDLNLYFKAANVDDSLTFSVADQNSNAVPFEQEEPDEKGFVKISIKDIAADKLGEEFYVTVTNGDKTVTVSYSGLIWVKSALASAASENVTKTLASAIGVYATEAQKKTVSQ